MYLGANIFLCVSVWVTITFCAFLRPPSYPYHCSLLCVSSSPGVFDYTVTDDKCVCFPVPPVPFIFATQLSYSLPKAKSLHGGVRFVLGCPRPPTATVL